MNEVLVEIDSIYPNPYQPRQTEDPQAVEDLAASILSQATGDFDGLLQPPTVRSTGKGYELAFGHTRRAAFALLVSRGHERYRFMRVFVRALSDLQLFEMAVTENLQRRDLNPMEQAEAMMRYMQDFGKTSVEAGAFFGVSPETVRGKVRLLQLPESVRAKIGTGEVNENNARRLLTLQRVAPQQVDHVAKKLTKNVDPDRVISEALTESETAVQMWQRWQSGEPQAGAHLWTLRMTAEKFPNDQLPELKPAEIAKSLGLEFTADLRTQIEDHLAAILTTPTFASDFAEQHPEQALLVERIQHLLFPPSCTACPMYAKVDGNHFCTLKLCHSRKTKAWNADTLARACRRFGVAMYDPKTDGPFVTLYHYNEADEALVAQKDPEIRMKKGQNWQNFDGVPDGFTLVLIGERAKKRHAAEQQSNRNQEKERERHWALLRAREAAMRVFLWNALVPSFDKLLEGVTQPVFLEEFADHFCTEVPEKEPDKKTPKAEKMLFYRRALIYKLLDERSSIWNRRDDKHCIVKLTKHIQGIATTYGVKLPKNILDLAAEADKAVKVEADS